MTAPMPAEGWRPILNQVIYGLRYVRRPDDAAAQVFAARMVQRRVFPNGPEDYHLALTQAVRVDRLFGPESLPSEHDEPAVRDFCARVVHHLEAARPWPPARFVKLPLDDWPWAQAPMTAVVAMGMHGASSRTWQIFDFVHRSDGMVPALVLRQRSGEVLALVVSTGPSPDDWRTTAVKVLDGDPSAAIASFLELTRLSADSLVAPAGPSTTPRPGRRALGEQEMFRVVAADGRLWRADNGIAFDTRGGTTLRPGPSRAIYVMDGQGNLYASLVETIGEFHHSSLLAGRPPSGAGEIVARDGALVEISGRSPTYPVGDAELDEVLAELARDGVPTAEVVVHRG